MEMSSSIYDTCVSLAKELIVEFREGCRGLQEWKEASKSHP